MPSRKRMKTNYPGVFYIDGISSNGATEKIYYARYRKNSKMIEEKVGRHIRNNMTPARASKIRTMKIDGEKLSNQEQRKAENASLDIWTVDRLWKEYKSTAYIKSINTDEGRYNKHIKPSFGIKEPKQISPFEVDRIKISLSKTLKPQTVKHVLVLLQRIVNFGVNRRLCESIGFKIQMPKFDNQKTEDLSPGQLNNLLKAIEEEKHIQAANFMKMVLFTGMRRGELFRLKWSDVDFEKGFITIRDPKGVKKQIIPLNHAARKLLHNYPRTESEYVFPGRDGKQLTNIYRPVDRIKKRARLPKDFRPLHGLRHVFASMLASSGQVDMYTLQKLLTHKSPQMTQRYAYLRDETLKRASNLVGKLINQAVNENQDKKVVNIDDYEK